MSTEVMRAEFTYRPGKTSSVGGFLLVTAGTSLVTYFALFADQLIDTRSTSLTLAQTRILFGGVAVLGWFWSVPIMGFVVHAAFTYDGRVAVTDRSLLTPRPSRLGFSREEIEISLKSITMVSVRKFIGNSQVLRIEYRGGMIQLASNMFASRRHFHQLVQTIHEAAGAARAKVGNQ